MLSQAITITVIVLALARFWLLRIGAIALRGLGQAVIAAFYADPNLTPTDWRIERKSLAPVVFCLDDRWGRGIPTRQPGGIERPPLPRTCPIRNGRYIQRRAQGSSTPNGSADSSHSRRRALDEVDFLYRGIIRMTAPQSVAAQ